MKWDTFQVYFSNSARFIGHCTHDSFLARERSSARTTNFLVWGSASCEVFVLSPVSYNYQGRSFNNFGSVRGRPAKFLYLRPFGFSKAEVTIGHESSRLPFRNILYCRSCPAKWQFLFKLGGHSPPCPRKFRP